LKLIPPLAVAASTEEVVKEDFEFLLQTTAIGADLLHKHIKWDNKAKEKEFKRQFVVHVTKKLRLIFKSSSTDYSKQVKQ
jgi:mitofusin